MAINSDKQAKLYYSIKEVAEEIGVNESSLRYWEKEFPFLKPKVSGNKVRQYTEKDIEQVKLIYNLIKVKGLKIAAARKYLSQNRIVRMFPKVRNRTESKQSGCREVI